MLDTPLPQLCMIDIRDQMIGTLHAAKQHIQTDADAIIVLLNAGYSTKEIDGHVDGALHTFRTEPLAVAA